MAILAGVGLVPARGSEVWSKVVAPQFTLYSPVKSEKAVRVATEFQQFIESLREVILLDTDALPPLTIVLFERQRDFRPFAPRKPNGKAWNAGGFFARLDGWSVFGLASSGLDEEVRRVVFHEGTHWFLSGTDRSNPPWLEEGLAEVFSTFVVENGRRQWGHPIAEHRQVLNSARPLPLERLLSVSHTDPLFNETRRTGLFYAESWAFVHYLLFAAHNQDRARFNDYQKAINSSANPDLSFRAIFKQDYAGMDLELEKYLSSGTYFVGSKPVSAVAVTFKAEPVSELEREVALARLALGAGRQELANVHLAAARRADPHAAVVSEVSGYAAAARNDTAGMLVDFAEAARLGSSDYRVYFEMAQRAQRGGLDFGGGLALSATQVRQIADGYAKAIELRPSFLPAYHALGGVVELLGTDSVAEQKILEAGLVRFPDDGMILLGLASVARHGGRESEARLRLDRVIALADQQTAEVNEYAQRMTNAWALDAVAVKITDLIAAQRYREALLEIDQFLAKSERPEIRQMLRFNRANVEASAQLFEAQTAWEDRRWVDARRILESMLAAPNQTGAQHEARRKLDELNRRNLGREG